MSVIRRKEDMVVSYGKVNGEDTDVTWNHLSEEPKDFICFWCQQPLTYPFIGWKEHIFIGFHRPCFMDWLPRIMRDVWACGNQTEANRDLGRPLNSHGNDEYQKT